VLALALGLALGLRAHAARAQAAAARPTLVFFWGIGCPHCEEATPFVDSLERSEPRLRVERVEVREDPAGRSRFLATMKRLDAPSIGIPTFVVGDSYVVGYVRGETDREVRALVAGRVAARAIDLPILGRIEPASVSLPALTLAIGLLDGINPCAIWVLLVLLGILLHVESRRHMVLYAGTFVVMSGAVYFLFMTAWSALFQLVGLSRVATMVLGGALLGIGLVNMKEVIWFRKGPSLVIPQRAKPALFRRMRSIAGAASTIAALGGIAVLAFVVNLIELGCTVGFPAIYTRVLSLRGLSAGARYAYLALYNAAYVVPLLLVVALFILLRRRLTLGEGAARTLKGVSGVLLAVFGALFLFAPDLLTRT
jgi:thiol-disulfide isomerase/thioredoxin